VTPAGKVLQARLKGRKEYPFAGDLLTCIRPRMDESVETMGVNMKDELFINPKWVDGLEPKQVLAVLIHEIQHCALLHPFRDPPEVMRAIKSGIPLSAELQYKHHIMNVACDLKVNYMHHEMGTFKDLPESDCKPTSTGHWSNGSGDDLIIVTDIHLKSAEQIYREILKQQPASEHVKCIELLCDHDLWPGARAGAVTQAELSEKAGDWMVRIANTLSNEKSRGSMPASMIRALEELLSPKLDWESKLDRFVQPIVSCGYSYKRPRRSSWAIGIILPGHDRSGIHIIVHVDTSGSMQKPELEQITAELYGILDSYPHVRITLLHSGAGNPKVIELRETDKEDILEMVELIGGGGTSHRPVVDWVLENNSEAVQALICFTDGESDIQACFDELTGVVARMLVLTREAQMERLEPYCEDMAYLPVG